MADQNSTSDQKSNHDSESYTKMTPLVEYDSMEENSNLESIGGYKIDDKSEEVKNSVNEEPKRDKKVEKEKTKEKNTESKS